MVSYDSYVRPGVAVDLCDFNVVPANRLLKESYQKTALLLAPSSEGPKTTKTGERDDTVILGINKDRAFVAGLVEKLFVETKRRGGGPLFPNLTLAGYERALRAAGKGCGYKFRVCPHMARHGGPSTDRLEEVHTLEEIQKRGKWNCFGSVMRYEKHGRLLKVLGNLPAATIRRASDAAGVIAKKFGVK